MGEQGMGQGQRYAVAPIPGHDHDQGSRAVPHRCDGLYTAGHPGGPHRAVGARWREVRRIELQGSVRIVQPHPAPAGRRRPHRSTGEEKLMAIVVRSVLDVTAFMLPALIFGALLGYTVWAWSMDR
jgi:hypothetical protein